MLVGRASAPCDTDSGFVRFWEALLPLFDVLCLSEEIGDCCWDGMDFGFECEGKAE